MGGSNLTVSLTVKYPFFYDFTKSSQRTAKVQCRCSKYFFFLSSKDDLWVKLWTLDKDCRRAIFAAIFIQAIWSNFWFPRVWKFSDQKLYSMESTYRINLFGLSSHHILWGSRQVRPPADLVFGSAANWTQANRAPANRAPRQYWCGKMGPGKSDLGKLGPGRLGTPGQSAKFGSKSKIVVSIFFLHCAPKTIFETDTHIYYRIVGSKTKYIHLLQFVYLYWIYSANNDTVFVHYILLYN